MSKLGLPTSAKLKAGQVFTSTAAQVGQGLQVPQHMGFATLIQTSLQVSGALHGLQRTGQVAVFFSKDGIFLFNAQRNMLGIGALRSRTRQV